MEHSLRDGVEGEGLVSVAEVLEELLAPPVVVLAALIVERVEEGDGNETSGFKDGADCGPEPVATPPGRSVVVGEAAVSSFSFFFIASSLSFTSLRMRRASVSLAFSL